MLRNTMTRLVLIALLCGLVLMGGCGKSSKKKSAQIEVEPTEQVVEPNEQPASAETVQSAGTEPKPEQPKDNQATGTAVEEKKEATADAQWQQTVPVVVRPLAPDTPKPEARLPAAKARKAAVKLALKFSAGDSANYRVIMDSEKSVSWEGPADTKPANFTGGHTGNRVEMAFRQQIQSVGDNGNATAKITITAVKYLARVKDNVVLDYDSNRQTDKDSPMARLIGQSYTIELTRWGEVANAVDIAAVTAAVSGESPADKAAQALLSPAVVKERHTIPALPAGDSNDFSAGDNWNSAKAFNFGMMGAKAYDRVYKLKEIQPVGDRQIAVAEMSAVPSVEQAQQLYKEQTSGAFSRLFDNTETYTGRLKLDVTSGRISEYYEQLKCEWIAVDPDYGRSAEGNKNEKPNALRMAATRLYHIEKID